MPKVFITEEILNDIADAIRYCKDSVAQIAPKDFAARIRELKYLDPTWLYFTLPQGGTVTLTKNGTPTAVTLEYSLDNGNTWNEWIETGNVRSLTLATGQTMHVRNTSETSTEFSKSRNSYYNFAFSSDAYAGGNTDSLLCKNPANAIITSYCYNSLYENCITLMTASLLPSENIAYGCYRFTFKGCTHLTLTEDFVLPATIIKGLCYGGMFQNCSALTLPSNFVLPATLLEANCYNTMFSNCSNVNSIKTLMTDISAANSLYRWTEYVAQTGDFYCPAELTIPTGVIGIPSGWTRHDLPNPYIFKESELADDDVALCVEVYDGLRFIKVEDVQNVDLTKFTVKPYVRFHRGKDGRTVVMHKSESRAMWAEYNRYKLECDTTAAGGFHWAITINGTVKSGDVTWAANDTIDSIVTQLNAGAVAGYLVFSHNSDENFIRVRTGGYTDSTFTLTNNTGATLIGLSLYTKIGNTQQAETHRTWQARDVAALFPNSGFLPANLKQYARNGYDIAYRCGGNLTRYKEYYAESGSSTYSAENSVSARMTPTAFANLNGSGVQQQQDLYDKYNGSWDAYMEASMVQIDDTHTDGIEYQSYDNGDTQNAILASITTMDFDGSYIPAYPAASYCASVTDTRLGAFHLPTLHELAVFIDDAVLPKINTAMGVIGGTALSYASGVHYWSVAPSSNSDVWRYAGSSGTITIDRSFYGLRLRPLAYIS